MEGSVRCLLVACLLGLALGYPSGAPNFPDECRSLKPGHKYPPQTLPPPFTITLTEEAYLPGEVITVTVKGKKDFRFRGFSIQARRADPRLDQNEAIGSFEVIPGSQEICAGSLGAGITHRSDSAKPEERNELVLKWKAPTPSQGHLVFRVTIVAQHKVFWVAERSSILRDPAARPLPPQDIPSIGTILPLTPITLDKCGKSKGCYRNPPDCVEAECEAVLTWKDMGTYIDFELSGDTDGWVAVGFSHDNLMGHDSVIECIWNKDTSSIEIAQSYNEKGDKRNTVLDSKTHGLTNMQGFFSNGHIKCRFSRQKRVQDVETIFDLTDKYYVLLAKGDAEVNDGKVMKRMHTLEPMKFPMVTPSRVDFTATENISGRARYALVKAHGCLMIIAWMMSASLGVIMARYYKRMWPNDRLCANKVWFSVHRFCQLLAMFCTIVGIILIFVHMGGWHKMPELPYKAHPPLGITVLVLCVLNPLIAICRCHPEHKLRPVFNWIHWFIGTVCFVLQSPTLFIGLSLPKAFTPWWATWVMVAFYLFHVVIELLLEIHGCINGRKQKQRDLEYEIRKRSDPRGELDGYEPAPVGTRFKTVIIWLYVIVMVILGLIMVIAVAIG